MNNKKNHLNLNLYKDCFKKECEFIPMCHTGCKFKSFVKDQRLDTKNCEYESLQNINREIIKSLYKL